MPVIIIKECFAVIKCKPERNPRQVTVIMICFVALFVTVAAAACIVGAYRWFFELLLLVVSAGGIFVLYRFSMTEMEYEVGDGGFAVYKTVGKKRTTACALDLSTAVTLLPKNEYEQKVKKGELPYINTRFNFNQNVRSAGSYVYVCEFNGKNIAAEFEPNAIFVGVMLEEIEKSKQNGEESGEDA